MLWNKCARNDETQIVNEKKTEKKKKKKEKNHTSREIIDCVTQNCRMGEKKYLF
jgi:hypothetical protein